MDIRYYDANKRRTDDPGAVAYIILPCQCAGLNKQYVRTAIAPVKDKISHTRSWNKNMDSPTIDGSFDVHGCPCHFFIKDGHYK